MAKSSKSNPGGARGRPKAPEQTGARLPIRISVDREALNALDKRAIAAQVGIGIVAGWLASWLVGGSGLLQYVVTGLAGSLIGGFLLERLGIDLGIRKQNRHCDGRGGDRCPTGLSHPLTAALQPHRARTSDVLGSSLSF